MFPRTEMLDVVLVDGKGKGYHYAGFGNWKNRSAQRARGACFARADMEMFSSFQRTQKDVMLRRFGERTKKAPCSEIHASLKFTLPVFLFQVIISRN
jgi:hypothetical protein